MSRSASKLLAHKLRPPWAGLYLTLAQGTHSITAVYSGDSRYSGSTSFPLSLAISAPEPACAVVYSAPVRIGGGSLPMAIAAADFNSDGRPDFAILNDRSGTVGVYLALAGGGFASPVAYPAPAHSRDIAVADFDGNGLPDIAIKRGCVSGA